MSPDDPISTLDRISLWMDTPERRLDFLVAIKLSSISNEALIRGAERARLLYPRANAIADGDSWVPTAAPAIELVTLDGTSRAAIYRACARTPLDPRRDPAIRQWVIQDGGTTEILTQTHHAAADGMSVLLFLRAQLDPEAPPPAPLSLRQHERPARKSRYAQWGPSTRLWTRRRSPSSERATRTFTIDARPMRSAPFSELGFTYNDVLGVAALSMVRRFQDAHGASTRNLSLWFPVSIRVDPFAGFGNGSSRIRVYERHLGAPSWVERARAFRAQVAWSKKNGEWAVPPRHPFLSLPRWLQRPILRAYFNRPWVDMGTLLYSHLEQLPDGPAFATAQSLEGAATLDRRHPAGLGGATIGDHTHLTLTWDPAQLDAQDAEELINYYQEAIASAEQGLKACAR